VQRFPFFFKKKMRKDVYLYPLIPDFRKEMGVTARIEEKAEK